MYGGDLYESFDKSYTHFTQDVYRELLLDIKCFL